MEKRHFAIARAMLWAALLLLGLSVYELLTRLSMFGLVVDLTRLLFKYHVPLAEIASVYAKHLDALCALAYLTGCCILAVWALFARRSRRGCAWLLLPCVLLCVAGFLLRTSLWQELLRRFQLLPLLALTLLCLAGLLPVAQRHAKKQPHAQPAPPPVVQVPVAPHLMPRKRRSRRRNY